MYYSPQKKKIINSNNFRNEFNVSVSPGRNALTGELANALGLVNLKPKSTPEIIEGYQVLKPNYVNISYNEDDGYATFDYEILELYPPVLDENGNTVKTREEVKAEREEEEKQQASIAAAEEALENRTSLFMQLKGRRNAILESTDKYTISDWPHASDEVRQSWITYRQSLRTMFDAYQPFDPEQTDPSTIEFPTSPDEV